MSKDEDETNELTRKVANGDKWHINEEVREFEESVYEVIKKTNQGQSDTEFLESKVDEIRYLIDGVESYLNNLLDEAIEKTGKQINEIIEEKKERRFLLDPNDEELHGDYDAEEHVSADISDSDDFEFHEHFYIKSSFAERIRYAIGRFYDIMRKLREEQDPVVLYYYTIFPGDAFEKYIGF